MTAKVTKNKEGLRNCPNQEEPKEVNVMWYPGWDPGAEKEH